MKKITIVVLTVCLFLTNLFIVSAATENLLINPGFEDGDKGWTMDARVQEGVTYSLNVTDEKAHSGKYSFKMENSAIYRNVIFQNLN
ncbi:MAG: hypothetical protein PUB07_08710, partial [Clostridia bacterium]|nr:hypothetical protein [Clostridia bacterium]